MLVLTRQLVESNQGIKANISSNQASIDSTLRRLHREMRRYHLRVEASLARLLHSSDNQSALIQLNIDATQHTLIPSNPPPAPSITLSPLHYVYFIGEKINVTCTPPHALAKRIIFYKEIQGIKQEMTSGKENTYIISTSVQEAGGKYCCGYLVEIRGRDFLSYPSNTTSIDVTDLPAAPSITLSPSNPVYTKGENITVTCTTIGGSAKRIIFYKENNEVKDSRSENTYVISSSVPAASGGYRCAYVAEIQKREVLSYASDTLQLTVTDTTTTTSIPQTYPVEEFQTTSDPTTAFSTLWASTNIPTFKDFTTNHSITLSSTKIPVWIYYTIGSSLIFCLLMCVVVLLIFRTCTSMKRKKSDTMPAPVWQTSTCLVTQSSESQKMFPAPVIPIQEQEEMENEHLYSEIDACPKHVKNSALSPRHPNHNSSKQQAPKTVASVYSTLQALDPVAPVYCTDMQKKSANKTQSAVPS
ncbi:uncharacterized protein O3C94_002466 [Discoglossus pictus]